MSVRWWMVLIYDISETPEFWIWKLKHEGDLDPPNGFIFQSFKATRSSKSFTLLYCYLYRKKRITPCTQPRSFEWHQQICAWRLLWDGCDQTHFTSPDPGCWFRGHETLQTCSFPPFTIVAWACLFHRAEQSKSWSHGASQGGKDPRGSSSPTPGSFSRRIWEKCHTHEGAGFGGRQLSEGWLLQWHISKQQGWFEAVRSCSEERKENSLFEKEKKRKKKGEKQIFKKLRSAAQGLVFLSPVVKENCCQKYKYLNSLWQRGRKWLVPVAEPSSAAPCEPEGFTSSPDLGTLSGAQIPLLSLPCACLTTNGPNLKAPAHMRVFPLGSGLPGPTGGGPTRRGAESLSSSTSQQSQQCIKMWKIFLAHSQPCWKETCCG